MICPYCNKESSEPNQKICEYCGYDLEQAAEKQIQPTSPPSKPKSAFESFIEDLGLKDKYQRVKKTIKDKLRNL